MSVLSEIEAKLAAIRAKNQLSVVEYMNSHDQMYALLVRAEAELRSYEEAYKEAEDVLSGPCDLDLSMAMYETLGICATCGSTEFHCGKPDYCCHACRALPQAFATATWSSLMTAEEAIKATGQNYDEINERLEKREIEET